MKKGGVMKKIIFLILVLKVTFALAQTSTNPFVNVNATSYSVMSGAIKNSSGYVSGFDNKNYIGFKGFNFGTIGADSLSLSVSVPAAKANQTIEVRLGSITGTVIGRLRVASTGSWSTFTYQRVFLNQKITGTKDIYFVGVGTSGIANIKTFIFIKPKPTITFTTVPANNLTATVGQFAFNVTASSTSKQILCAYDSTIFSNCTSPVAVVSPAGTHKFQVKVIDLINNLTTVVSYSWSVSRGYLPYVNLARIPPPEDGSPLLNVKPTTLIAPEAVGGVSSFRITCRYSHMANNDPIVFPKLTGASHLHTFFGNNNTNAFSTNASLTSAGNSTCNGGIMNRSAYWIPSMIDTTNGAPVKPDYIMVYYKANDPAKVTAPPPGLRMIAQGSENPTGPVPNAYDRTNHYSCNKDIETRQESIPYCKPGDTLGWMLVFPDCWNGRSLDSPDHKSHMAYSRRGLCPTTHPVLIPQITFNVHWTVNANGTSKWRLASDNYPRTSPGGYSGHGDWMNGWDPVFMQGFVRNCLKANKDCHSYLLGDGRMFYK